MQSSEDILLISVLEKELTVPNISRTYRMCLENRLDSLLERPPSPQNSE